MIRKLLREVSANKTVLFSTHIMQEVVELCDETIFLKSGTIRQRCGREEIEKGAAHLEQLFTN